MGIMMSFLGKGGPPPSAQLIGVLMGTLYNQFVEKDITDFDDFHISVLNIFNTFNSALPGKHFDVPSRGDIEGFYVRWKEEKAVNKKLVFVKFMMEKVSLSKLDDYTVITGIITPPAAMVAKKAGENIPQLKVMKAIPDVLFVPSATVLALITAKLSRRISLRSLTPDPPYIILLD
ncbi:hypothetical protein MLD38_021321 [Melastoma candidum]|uniref:Uncharacterized protein n=1 Tax=Melastoma candidum TaxID=119954 RepID=A0ACB9QGP9_9MYRT|nr:hypothetical protein MLD38_021321 [Melastoma candidum]